MKIKLFLVLLLVNLSQLGFAQNFTHEIPSEVDCPLNALVLMY